MRPVGLVFSGRSSLGGGSIQEILVDPRGSSSFGRRISIPTFLQTIETTAYILIRITTEKAHSLPFWNIDSE